MAGLVRSFWLFFLILFCLLEIGAELAYADITSDWNRSDESSTVSIDHSPWQDILGRYLNTGSESGINLFDYGRVGTEDRKRLKRYLSRMQSLDPRNYNRRVQMAYWINLYNGLTVDLVIDHYPVKSIKKIGGLFSFGPWDEVVARISGNELTLNDIEHRILRPIWKDPRIHYAVNCASLGCPNLAPKAYSAEHLDTMLDEGARDYVNHPRGVRFVDGELIISSIYHWYHEDFGADQGQLLLHLQKYAKPELKARLGRYNGSIDHEYDWSLNAP
jgi:Protein of unknown function, DUF547